MRAGLEQRVDRRKCHRRILHHWTSHWCRQRQQSGTRALASNDAVSEEANRRVAHATLVRSSLRSSRLIARIIRVLD